MVINMINMVNINKLCLSYIPSFIFDILDFHTITIESVPPVQKKSPSFEKLAEVAPPYLQ